MIGILRKRLKTGLITPPGGELGPPVPGGARGQVRGEPGEVPCPTGAIGEGCLDRGKCILCGNCPAFSPVPLPPLAQRSDCRIWEPEGAALGGLTGSLQVRHLDAGSCNACEQELAALNGPHYDFQRFGLDLVVSPRHADVLLVTGPVTVAMAEALERTWEAIPGPKILLAAGTCAVSGGIFRSSYATGAGLENWAGGRVVWLPGCPPRPQAMLAGLLACREILAKG